MNFHAKIGICRFKILCFNCSPYDRSCDIQWVDKSLSDESRLINCLLHRYRRVTTLARPVRDSSDTILVQFGISIVQILDFDETKQIITTSIWKNYVRLYFHCSQTFIMKKVIQVSILKEIL